MIFQFFGSKSSIDYDVMVFVDTIPSIKESSILCEEFNYYITEKILECGLSYRKVNSNIGILKDGVIIQTHKGTHEEVNNSMFITYSDHYQFHPNQIKRLVERDIDLKVIRCARIILTFLSRTQYRDIIKKSLIGDFNDKLKVLQEIDFSLIQDLGTKGPCKEDVYKSISFQLGQTIGLMRGLELYSKESIIDLYQDLKPFLMRSSVLDMTILNTYKDIFISESKLRDIKNLIEPIR